MSMSSLIHRPEAHPHGRITRCKLWGSKPSIIRRSMLRVRLVKCKSRLRIKSQLIVNSLMSWWGTLKTWRIKTILISECQWQQERSKEIKCSHQRWLRWSLMSIPQKPLLGEWISLKPCSLINFHRLRKKRLKIDSVCHKLISLASVRTILKAIKSESQPSFKKLYFSSVS